jgi:hypothetical protein
MLAYWRDHAPTSGSGVTIMEPRNAPNYHLGHWLTCRFEEAPLAWILGDLAVGVSI